MDVNEAMRMMVDAMLRWENRNRMVDRDDLREYAATVLNWMNRGGFAPSITPDQLKTILKHIVD